MAGNRIDMIERAAARLRRDAPAQKPVIDQKPTPNVVALPPGAAPVVNPPVPTQPVTPAPYAAQPAISQPAMAPPITPPRTVAPPVVISPATPAPAAPSPQAYQAAPQSQAAQTAVPGKGGVKHSRTVVLDTARLTLAGTVDWTSDRTPVMEELRLIKRRLLRRAFDCDRTQNPLSHLVMITSAKPREGKTFAAMNIAISISLEEDYNVLLVDADIRRQALRQNLGLEASQGFVDLLLNPNLDMADVLLKTNIPRLSVLPAGTLTDRAPELLASSRMKDLIGDMARRYHDRIIIFDTAPCLVSSDAATLAAHVGQVVFVVEAEQTQQHEIIAALNLISACPEIALILNKAQPLATTSYGGYGAY
jgi:exopolysaccharide/PEP-CTERM locus tyrosine autokinase